MLRNVETLLNWYAALWSVFLFDNANTNTNRSLLSMHFDSLFMHTRVFAFVIYENKQLLLSVSKSKVYMLSFVNVYGCLFSLIYYYIVIYMGVFVQALRNVFTHKQNKYRHIFSFPIKLSYYFFLKRIRMSVKLFLFFCFYFRVIF